MTQASVPPQLPPAWSVALRRGATLGVVATFHLALLALLLRPAPYREAPRRLAPRADDVLQLIFIPPPVRQTPVAKAFAPQRPRYLPLRSPTSQRIEHTSRAPTHVAPMTAPACRRPHPIIRQLRGTRLAISALACRTHNDRGSCRYRWRHTTDRRSSPAGSAQCAGSRATAGRGHPLHRHAVDMQKSKNQFITGQLLDRMLEADGCGPHAEHMPDSATVDALTRQLLDER